MTDDMAAVPDLPTADGHYEDRHGDVWQLIDGWLFRGRHDWDTRDPKDAERVLADYAPFTRMVAYTADELEVIRDLARQLRSAITDSARLLEKFAGPQDQITDLLIHADRWRAIAEKTGAV